MRLGDQLDALPAGTMDPDPRMTETTTKTKTTDETSASGADHSERFPAGPLSFGRRKNLEVRLASTEEEIKAAQALRYHVFYEEMSAEADAETLATKLDADRFDTFCDHLLVIDHNLVPEGLPLLRPGALSQQADRGIALAWHHALCRPLRHGCDARLCFIRDDRPDSA